jgi:glycosyltransferase involved in cell wall biosynthesis
MSGLRFAMVTTFYPPYHFGGDAVFIRRLTHALARRGHEVEVIHDVDAYDLFQSGEAPSALEEPDGVVTHPLRSANRPLGTLSCLLTHQLGRPVIHGARIRSILERGDFDVIHFHNLSLVGGPKALRYGDAIKLYMAHEHWLVCPTHVLWRHARELCDEKQCLRCSLHHHRPPQLWRHTGLLERETEQLDAILSPSAFSAAKHREFGFPHEFEVMPYFLPDLDSADIESATPLDAAPAWERPYFLFVGRLEQIKGLQDVIPHFATDAPADLVVIGTGDYEAQLQELARSSPRVHFLGRLTPEAIRPFYRDAIATVVPSLCYETFGIVVLESFREATPVIVRRLGPLPEVVEPVGGGLTFETEDELGAALQRLTDVPGLGEAMGAAGHEGLRARWLESCVLEQYFGIISRAAEQRKHERVLKRLGSTEAP